MTDTAFVTGATGFLGTHLCRTLANHGWTVHGLCSEDSDVSLLAAADWHVGDVLDPNSLVEPMRECDVVFHLASADLATADEETVWDVNALGTRHALATAQDAGVDRFLFTSTAGTRRSAGVANEFDRAPPIDVYQESKAFAENLVHDAVDEGLDAVVTHPTSVFGPGDGRFTARLLKLATDRRMFAYVPGGASIVNVDDVAAGIVAAAERGREGEHYILGGENLTYGDALDIIARHANGSVPRVCIPPAAVHAMGPVASLVAASTGRRVFPFSTGMAHLVTQKRFYSSEKARRHLGYEYRPLDEHVDDAIQWYRGNAAQPLTP